MSYGDGDSDGGDSTGGCGCGGGDDSSSSSSGSDASNSGGGYGSDSSNSGGGVGTDGGTDSNDGNSGGVGGASDGAGTADESNDGGAGATNDGNGDDTDGGGVQTETSNPADGGIQGGIPCTYSSSTLDNIGTYYGTTDNTIGVVGADTTNTDVENQYSFDYSKTELAQLSTQTMEEDQLTQAISQSLTGQYGALDDTTGVVGADTTNIDVANQYSFDYSQTELAQLSTQTMEEDSLTQAINQSLAEQYGALDNSVGFVGADTTKADVANQYSFDYSQTELGQLENLAATRAEETNMVNSYLAQQTENVDTYAQDFHDFAVNECGVKDAGLEDYSFSLGGDTITDTGTSLFNTIGEEFDKTQFGLNTAVCTTDGFIGKAIDVVGKSVPNFKALAAEPGSLTEMALTGSKYAGKFVGGMNIVNTGYSVYQDCETYDGDNCTYAVVADATAGLIGVGVAAVCSVAAFGVLPAIGLGIIASMVASYTANTFKENLEKKN